MTLLLIAVLLGLVVIGSPLFVIVGGATALSLALFTSLTHFADLRLLVQHMENLATKQEFLAIPLFVASGAIMTAGGIARRLVELMRVLLCWLPGGLAVAAVMACMFFAAISGSSPVTLIAVGSMMLPALLKSGYEEDFSLGLLTTAGSLGCLVPPSISMLIYAISVSGSAAVDPSDLFLAGLGPALLVAGLLAVYSIATARRQGLKPQKFSWSEVGEKWREGFWALLLPVVVLGGIYGGWTTPSQAGAVAMAYAAFLTLFLYRELTPRALLKTLQDSAVLMGTLIPIIVLAFGLNEFLALINVQDLLLDWIREHSLSPALFMLLVNTVLIVLGALMDSISATLIFAPLLAPIAQDLFGIDPVHFGVVFVVNMEIGYLMPPVATNLFVASAVFKKPFPQVARAVWPTLGLTVVALLMIIFLPSLSLAPLNFKQGQPMWVAFPWNGKSGEAEAVGAEKKVPTLKSLTGKILDEVKK